ncbi:hypothetical protein CXB51_002058 [Gossypium anomalum]|uniref:Fe2OG dioxygenase domain-containing protein n=1 Tax=Gossypium anomalum TaxID=47600 RepID=A0A8J5ZK11_9ROSI|nr:hypothetical protein CXB51_002058 [Gossypium anomalum]
MVPSFDNETSLFNFVVRDGNGIKGIVDSGISNVPQPYIQPPAEQINKKNASSEIPPIDLSKLDGPEHDEVANQIELLRLLDSSNMGRVLYEKALEWKDYISMAYTNDDEALQQWPVECRDVALQYLKTSREMVRKLLEALLGNLGVELDDSKIDAFIGKKMVNMNFYPTCPNLELKVGVGRHSDMGTLTILLQDGIGGLYVKVPEVVDMEKKGEWVEIPPIPGALVINVGDMLQIWSNGRYKSAEHRVRTTSTKSRVSIPIFTCPQSTQKIAPLPQVVKKDGIARYREFIFSDYMDSFFGNAHDDKKSLEFAKINSA